MKKLLYTALALTPNLAFAQQLGGIEALVRSIGRIVGYALPIVVGLALLGFFWGLMKFIFAAGNEEQKTDGKKIMIYGVIALFVVVSVWGLVRFIGNQLGITEQGGSVNVPTVTLPQ